MLEEVTMDLTQRDIVLHPELLNTLFAHKSKTRTVFSDVLGLHEINHIAITYINPSNELITLSSTPSLEFNLFNSQLWRFDYSYAPVWFKQCRHATWQSLYAPERYDELYYLKQIKPRYPLGTSLATMRNNRPVIYSLASASDSEFTREIFAHQTNELIQLGHYCMTQLFSLLSSEDEASSLIQLQTTGAL